MAGVAFQLETKGLEEALKRLATLSRLEDFRFLDALGALGVAQTQRRIASEKTTPEGVAWKANAEGGSILFKSGALFDSVDHAVSGQSVSWGSGMIYARIHQLGGVITPVNGKALCFTLGGKKTFAKRVTIPARAWLGMSQANKREMEDVAAKLIGELLS